MIKVCRLATAFALLGLCAAFANAQPSIVQLPSLTLEAAVKTVTAAMADCRKQGALVAVAVTDRAGNVLAVLRDPLAGMHTVDTATRKAWTALSFRNATSALEKATGPTTANSGIRQLPGVAMIGGGLPIEAAGSLVGAIGISGAPSGELDESCAKVGIEVIRDDLEMGF
jgi:uncharacterized protein GlcG (DUF336 family)